MIREDFYTTSTCIWEIPVISMNRREKRNLSRASHLSPFHTPAADKLMITYLFHSSSCILPTWVYLLLSLPDFDHQDRYFAWTRCPHSETSTQHFRWSPCDRSVWLVLNNSSLRPQLQTDRYKHTHHTAHRCISTQRYPHPQKHKNNK